MTYKITPVPAVARLCPAANGDTTMRYSLLLKCSLFALLIWVMTACVPITAVQQPHLTLHVYDESGLPVPASQVTLYWWEDPHSRLRASSVHSVDDRGDLTFEETTAAETIMPLVPHGVPAYHWTFCIEAEGFKPLIGTVSDVKPGESVEVWTTLRPGANEGVCSDYQRLHYHPGTPRPDIRSTGARVHGVYEVDGAP
jgi:hypothetical protein